MRQLLVGIGALVVSWAAAAGAATVERFTPVGEVRAVRQAAARFSEDMVRFGDPKAPAPFDIVCAEAGQGRWIDSRNWVFDFSRDLPPGTRCSFKAKGELRALAGGALSGAATFAFSTGGPAVLSIQPYNGSSAVDEEQVFVLKLNGANSSQYAKTLFYAGWLDALQGRYTQALAPMRQALQIHESLVDGRQRTR